MSDPAVHAYDPHVAQARDGMVYVIYSAFVYGNYHILLQNVKCGETVRHEPVKERSFACRWTAARDKEQEYWYCRVLLINGEVFWTSPIWLEGSTAHCN